MNPFIALLSYLLTSIAFYMLAKKADYSYPIFAFVPILNLILVLNIAGLNGWFVLIYFIPFVNVIFGIIVAIKFYMSYEGGMVVVVVNIIFGLLSIIVPIAGIAIVIVLLWLAVGNNEFIGECYS